MECYALITLTQTTQHALQNQSAFFMPTIFVYALKNTLNDEVYVGISADPVRRLAEHNKGKNRYTNAFLPWEIFFMEEQPDYNAASIREKYFKTAAGKRWLNNLWVERHE